MLGAAIERVRRLRTSRQRRETLACLLARAERWKELHAVLDTIPTAEEAARVVWRMSFQLPGATEE